MAFTGEEQAFCTLQFEASPSIKMTMRKFFSKFKKKSPSDKSIKKWHSNFVKAGKCTTLRKAPPPTVFTLEAAAAIKEHFEENQYCSIRRASLALEMKKSSVQKILKSNNWYPYKINIVQKLNEHDRILRKAFAEADLCRIQSDPSHLSYLTFSDEGHFHLDGRVNRHNSRSGLVLTFDGLVKRVSIRRALPYGLPYGKVEFTVHSFSKETCLANRTSKCSRNHFGLQLRKKE